MKKLFTNPEQLLKWRLRMKDKGFVVVATNGCFDIIHAGHVDYLSKARKLGHRLVIGLNSDTSVRSLKGESRPINDQNSRAYVLGALHMVTKIFIFDGVRASKFLELCKPDIWVKGGDYTIDSLDSGEKDVVVHHGGRIHIIPFIHKISTTDILKRAK